MKKSFLVIMAMVIAAIGIMGYALYLMYNAMQVADVLEEDLNRKEDFFANTNGQSHEPKKDTDFAETQSSEEKESNG